MKIKVGNIVKVITGESKGKEGKVIKVLTQTQKVVVEGVNIIKKHVKPNTQNETGGILEIEAPIHVSNIKLIENKSEKTSKSKTTKKESKSKVK